MGACRTWIISSPGWSSLTWTRGSRSFPGRRRRRPSAARCLWTSRLDTSPSPDTSPLSSAPARRPSGACRRTEPDICGGWQEQSRVINIESWKSNKSRAKSRDTIRNFWQRQSGGGVKLKTCGLMRKSFFFVILQMHDWRRWIKGLELAFRKKSAMTRLGYVPLLSGLEVKEKKARAQKKGRKTWSAALTLHQLFY